MFIHEEKQSLKSAKWKAGALNSKPIRFHDYTIYKIYIEEQNKVIWVKNLQIFKDIISKVTISLLDFDKKPIFDGVQIPNKESDKYGTSKEELNVPKRPAKTQARRMIKLSLMSKTKDRDKKNNELIIQLIPLFKDN